MPSVGGGDDPSPRRFGTDGEHACGEEECLIGRPHSDRGGRGRGGNSLMVKAGVFSHDCPFCLIFVFPARSPLSWGLTWIGQIQSSQCETF